MSTPSDVATEAHAEYPPIMVLVARGGVGPGSGVAPGSGGSDDGNSGNGEDSSGTGGRDGRESREQRGCGPVFAVWQVETDATVSIGDFSGAWIVDDAGVHGFAADADWIAERHDRDAMLANILRYPVILVDEHVPATDGPQRAAVEEAMRTVRALPGVQIADWEATQRAAEQAVDEARRRFAEEFPGKRQPSWGELAALELQGQSAADAGGVADASGAGGAGETTGTTGAGDATDAGDTATESEDTAGTTHAEMAEHDSEQAAIAAALRAAHGLREWVRQWNAFDKLRKRRLGEKTPEFSVLSGVPIVCEGAADQG